MIGSRLSAYEVLAELGSGGMGSVYLAECAEEAAGLDQGVRVALKVIHPNLLSQPGFFKRFLREAQIGQDVQHDNVVRTYDCDATLGADGHQQNFLVMEYVEGQTLRDLLKELERVPEELCRHIGREVAKGLSAIHEAGVLHRDIKPENVLITEEHVVKVMDLGVARLQDEAIRLSQAGAFVGSLEYAAPEQFRTAEGEPDGRADLHALGVLLYELSTGQHPYREEDASKMLRNILDVSPRKAGEVNPQLSPFYEEVVADLLAKEPGDRFADAPTLAAVLGEGEQGNWWKERAKALRTETKRPLRRIRIPRETVLYGRDDDLAKLHVLYEKAKDGDGQVLLIEGEAGIGKTRLVDEFVGRLRQEGEDVNFLFGSYPPGGAATASGAFSEAYREQFGEQGLEDTLKDYMTVTPILIPAFVAILKGETTPKDAEPLTKDSLQTVFVHATRALAAERTTIVLIDDLHFAPQDGRALFSSLAMAISGHRVLLLGTMRPGVPEDWIANVERLDHASRSVLGRLGPKDLTRLLRDAFGSERLARELAYQIGEKSDGNPFFAFEIIRGLREGQFISQQPDGTWVTTKVIEDIEVPSSVLDLVNARIADLSDDERNLLDVAACWGFDFDPTLIGSVLDMARIPTLQVFAKIEKRHRLVRSVGRDYVFDHHQVQEALYCALNEQLREEYHAALAEALEVHAGAARVEGKDLDGALTVDLCEHYLRGAQGAKALRYLDAAFDHLEVGYQNETAQSLADRALAVEGLLSGSPRAHMLLRKASCLAILAQRDDERIALEEALEIGEEIGDVRLLVRCRTGLGRVLAKTSRFDEAKTELDRALGLARQSDDLRLQAGALRQMGVALRLTGQFEMARTHIEQDAEISRRIGDRAEEATSLCHLGGAFWQLGKLEQALRCFERALTISRDLRIKRTLTSALLGLSLIHIIHGRFSEAREHLQDAHALSLELGDRHFEMTVFANLGSAALGLGEFEEALALYDSWHRLARETGNPATEARSAAYQALARIQLGELSQAAVDLREALQRSHEVGARGEEAEALRYWGELQSLLGDHEGARRSLERALELHREAGARREWARDLWGIAHLEELDGRSGEARAHLEKALDTVSDAGDPIETGRSHYKLGTLLAAAGEFAGAHRHFRDALSARTGSVIAATHVLATCRLSLLPGGEVDRAFEAFAEHGPRLGRIDTMDACFLLWQATEDPRHLTEAKRLLDHLVEHAPEEYRESMLKNVRLHREIMEAWEEHGAGV